MCGFAGELRFDGLASPRMAAVGDERRMAPRGPDGAAFWAPGRSRSVTGGSRSST